MHHRVKKRIVSILLPMLAATSIAQDAMEDEAPPEIRRYTVEMIIFSYDQNIATGSEIFVPDEPPPLDPATEELVSAPAATIRGKKRPYELVMLAEDDFTLLDAYERLDNLDAYTPLIHFGWTQPTYPEEDTESRPLYTYITPPRGLQGELKLYLSRYLHLVVNLQLDAPVQRRFESGLENSYDNAAVYPVRYRISEDRIFRNGELRYFDHPKFGVLAKITRVEEKKPTNEELLGESELLGFGPE